MTDHGQKPGLPDPKNLAVELASIHDELLELRKRTARLGREFVWLDASTVTAHDGDRQLNTDHALHAARSTLDDFTGALGLATDAVTLAQSHLARLALRNQH